MARTRKKTLIKRYPFPYTKRGVVTTTVDADNPFANSTEGYSFTRGQVEYCTIQTMNGWEIKNLPEGPKTSQVFKLFTNTNLFTAIESTKYLADSIYIPEVYFQLNGEDGKTGMGGWYNVTTVQYFNNGVIPHIEAIISRDDYTDNKDGLTQYPDTTTLDSEITTKEELQSGDWLTSWEGEN